MNEFVKNIIENSFNDAALVVDKQNRVVNSNDKASVFLKEFELLDSGAKSIDMDRNNEFVLLLNSITNLHSYETRVITLKSERSIKVFDVGLSPIPQNEKNEYLLLIKEHKSGKSLKYKFCINETEIDKYLLDEQINSILEKVKTSYPFTFIGRQKFQREIDKLNREFWIKEPNGKVVLANKEFAQKINVKQNQIQGRNIKEFFNSIDAEVMNNSDNFLNKTARTIIIQLKNDRYLQFPLVDLDGNIAAIISFSVEYENDVISVVEKPAPKITENYFSELSSPILILNEECKKQAVSKSYEQLFFDHLNNLIDTDSGLPKIILPDVKKFIVSKEENVSYPDCLFQTKDKQEYLFQLRKIFKESKLEYILVEPTVKITSNYKTELKVKMYDIIMHTSPEPMFIYNIENLKFLEVNHAALNLYGYTKDEFLEMDLTDLYAPEDIQTLIETSPSKTTSSDFTGPWRHKHKTGKNILVEISKSTLEYSGKRAHFNIIRDVTQYLEEKKQLQKFKAAFDNTSDLIIMTDKDGFITTYNSNFLEKFGYSQNKPDQKPLLSLIVDEDRARINSEIFHSGIKTKISFNTKVKAADGSFVQAKIIADPITDFDDNIESFNLTIKPKEDFADQQDEKTVGNTISRHSIDPSFLSNLFHEILTPINVITGFVQELSESIQAPNEEQKEAIGFIKDNQQMLLQIMDNAVEYSNLEQQNFEIVPESIVFVEILEEIEENVSKFAKSKNVDFSYGKISSSLKFVSDKQKFTTLISLLVKVAITASNKKKIYLSAYQTKNQNFIVSLKDDRASISAEMVKNINDIFTLDENVIKQNFGISRFALRLTRRLAMLLQSEREVIKHANIPNDYAFEFPIELIIQTKISDEAEEPENNLSASIPQIIINDDVPELPKVREQESVLSKDIFEHLKETALDVDIQPAEKNVDAPDIIIDSPSTSAEIENEPEIQITSDESEELLEVPATVENKISKNFTELSCLYVEDQVDSQILFKVQMKDLKLIEFATSFEKALPLIQSRKFDFIVMDINLQGEYNGLDALRAIQKMPEYSKIPIIAVTAYVLPGDKEKFIKAGFRDFISKPILRDKLKNVIGKIF